MSSIIDHEMNNVMVGPELEVDEFYKEKLGDIVFCINRRYELIEVIGQGAYGVVAAAKDKKSGEMVAIKKMQHTFEHSTFTKRTLRELRILRNLKHENVVRIRDINTADGERMTFDEIYVVCDLMETDLGAIIKSDQPLYDEHFQFFLYQILRGLKYCHSAGVVHRDLKPRNLLVNANCDLKICDFGLARVIFPDEPSYPREMTEYVATRWYRAPEILWAWPRYGAATDMWSAGCILAELLGRAPLFPGRNTQHQLKLILTIVGTPSAEQLAAIPNARCREFILSLPVSPRVSWETFYPQANPLALNLLDRMLRLLPEERITVDEALAHPYLAVLHHPEDEPIRAPLEAIDFAYEKCSPSTDVLRAELWREAHPELFGDSFLPHQTIYPPPSPEHQLASKMYQQAITEAVNFHKQQRTAAGGASGGSSSGNNNNIVHHGDMNNSNNQQQHQQQQSSFAGDSSRTHLIGPHGNAIGITAKYREEAIYHLAKQIREQQHNINRSNDFDDNDVVRQMSDLCVDMDKNRKSMEIDDNILINDDDKVMNRGSTKSTLLD